MPLAASYCGRYWSCSRRCERWPGVGLKIAFVRSSSSSGGRVSPIASCARAALERALECSEGLQEVDLSLGRAPGYPGWNRNEDDV